MATADDKQALVDFAHAVKDDPGLTDGFRDAALQLADALDPPKKGGKDNGSDDG